MDRIAGQKRAAAYLYPQVEPFDQRLMDVTGGGAGGRVFASDAALF
jgi:hypothetical protein